MTARRNARAGPASAGFTLVEVMVALVVLALGALSIMQVSLSVAVLMQRAGARTQLITAVDNRLESVQARPFGDLRAGTEEDTVVIRGLPYRRRVTIAAPNSRLREIRVEITSPSRGGPRHSAQTLVSRP